MKFMVEILLQPGTRNAMIESFEAKGPNRNPGVTFRGAWIGTKSDVVFVLVEADNPTLIDNACCAWNPPGELKVHPVVDVDQY